MKGFLASLYSPAGLFLFVLLAARLTFIQQIGLNLTPDEAYYWDWSRSLAWGYYSKPPLVAWLIHLSTLKLGHSEYAVRVPAALCHTLFLAFIYYLGQRLFDRKVGLWAAVAAAASPISAVYSFVMTIDPPLFAFWAAALCLAWQASESRKITDFLKLGLVVGLGLLTKQTMVAFLPLYFAWLAAFPAKRDLLREKRLYLAPLLALLLFLPNLYWNMQHGWITFKHTSTHFQEETFNWTGPLKFLLEQAGVITPVIFGLILLVFYTYLKRPKLRKNEKLGFLFFFSAIPLALVLPLALLRKVNANWPHPFYASAFVLTSALILRGRWPEGKGAFWRKIFFLGVVFGMFLMVTTYQLPRTPQKFPPKVQRLLYKFYGWKELATAATPYLKEGLPVITVRRDYAAELAFYLPQRPRPYVFWRGSIESQYDLWDGLPDLLGQNALLVLKHEGEIRRYRICFEEVKYLSSWEKNIFGKRRRAYFYYGYRLKDCPYLGPK